MYKLNYKCPACNKSRPLFPLKNHFFSFELEIPHKRSLILKCPACQKEMEIEITEITISEDGINAPI